MPLQMANMNASTSSPSIAAGPPHLESQDARSSPIQETPGPVPTLSESNAPQASATSEAGTLVGIAFAVMPEEVREHVKRQRSSVFFGQKEVLGDVQRVYRELFELGIGVKKGILTKRYETKYLLLDSETQKFAQLGNKLVLADGLEPLVGLRAMSVQVLRSLSESKYVSAADIGDMMKISSDSARNILQELERHRLVKSSQMGRVRVYQRITNIPDMT